MSTSAAPNNTPPQIQNVPNVPMFYVEGISQMALGFPNSRIMLHSMAARTSNDQNAPVMHNLAVELVIPTASLVELTQTLVNQLQQNQGAIKEFGAEWMQKVNSLVDSLNQKIELETAENTATQRSKKKSK
jgi:hypothetical protein